MQGPYQPHLDLFTKANAASAMIPHFKFVVIIPSGSDAEVQQLLSDVLFPPTERIGIGEVEMRAFIVPEA